MFKHSPFSRFGHGTFMGERDENGRRGFGHRGGGPFGRHRGGPFGGRGSRMFDTGALRLVVLGLIAAEPRHGYDIIKALETRFGGAYSPSPGSIYPMLQMLEEADLVTSTVDGNKRLYAITAIGRGYLADNAADLARINAQIDEVSGREHHAALVEDVSALRAAIIDKLRGGRLTAEQIERARQILRDAREAFERL